METLKPTAARLILVRELAEGPKKFGQLRTAYFGEGRAAEKATTAFYNKLKAGLKENLIVKSTTTGAYELGVEGNKLLAWAKEQKMDLSTVKSEAQIRFEQKQA